MTKRWRLSRIFLFCMVILLFVAGSRSWAEAVSREAQKYMNRGMAAAEMANSPSEYEEAIREFEQAVNLAPDWPAPYFNLGWLQKENGQYQESLDSYRKYLELAPNASDTEQVQVEIDQIEYKLEKIFEERQKEDRMKEKYSAVLGIWQSEWKDLFPLSAMYKIELRDGQLMVDVDTEYIDQTGERWVPAEFDGTTLTFHYGAASVSSDFRAENGYDSWHEISFTVKFSPYGSPEGHVVRKYTDPGYDGFDRYGRVQKARVAWERGSEEAFKTWRSW